VASGRLRALLLCGFLLPCALEGADPSTPLKAGVSPAAQGAPITIDGRAALQKAAVLVQQGRLEGGERQARLALADPTTMAAAYSVLGAIRLRQNRLEESAKFLQEAIRLEPCLPGAHLNLAELYALQEKRDLPRGILRRVLELDPQLANVPDEAASRLQLRLLEPDR